MCERQITEEFEGSDVTPWGSRHNLIRVLGSGCDAVRCERQCKEYFERRCDTVGCERQFTIVLGSGCDAVGCERQFQEGFARRM